MTIKYISNSGPYSITVRSTKTNKIYILKFHRDKQEWYCSCPQYVYRGKTCKHVRALMAGEIDSPQEICKIDEFA